MKFRLYVFHLFLSFGVFGVAAAFTKGAHAIVMGLLGAGSIIAAAIVQLARAIEDGNRPAEGGPK